MKYNTKLIQVIKTMVEIAEQDDGDDYFNIVSSIALIFPSKLTEQLKQLVKNPTYDGDVICKSYRDELLTIGLATRVCCGGQQGYTAAKYIAYSVLNKLQQI
jgi:hypothetical protein